MTERLARSCYYDIVNLSALIQYQDVGGHPPLSSSCRLSTIPGRTGRRQVRQDIAALLAQGRHGGQDALHELTARTTLRPKTPP